MDNFDANVAIIRAHKVLKFHKLRSYNKVILPLVSHLAAIVTIGVAWFNRAGSFKFSPESLLDWIMSFVLIGFASCIYLIIKSFVDSGSIKVTRDQASDLVALARSEAESSFINISGDLSWLKEDYLQLKALKENKPHLKMQIYYDSGIVSAENLEIMKRLISIGIEFTPYPHAVSSKMKCILVDRESVNHSRLFAISKIPISETVDPRDTGFRLWQAYTDRSSLTFKGVISFLDILEKAKPKPILIGISGINNVGKTTFASKLYERLRTKFNTDLVDDVFKQIQDGTSIGSNYFILFSQLKNMGRNDAEIMIFDQTIIDTFCYLRMRTQENDTIIHNLGKEIAEVARSFDLLINLNKSYDDYSKSSQHITLAERKFMREAIEDFFKNYHIEKIDVVINGNGFNHSTEENIERITEMISEIRQKRSA